MKKVLFAAICLLIAVPVFADTVDVFKFDQNRGNIGLTDILKLGIVQFVISGYNDPGVAGDIWEKNQGPTETGLGLASEVDHEIGHGNNFLQLDLTRLNDNSRIDGVAISLNSIQAGESYNVWGSNTEGQLGMLLAANQTSTIFDLPKNFDFISITSRSGDVTLDDVDVSIAPPVGTPTPEPGTGLSFLLGGMFLAGGTLLRKKRV